ncbi:uncharacterized protein ARMOST_19912 [Armillaria ostoyae]|uniref:Uncharacterized protein n=1 Tax=Armillaria ostoyae TaxID=47428 RepID=A0A284S5V2_ARMOS|nr:uncharacterized protein ARMOST_19912 [Armillaria ostoyae]
MDSLINGMTACPCQCSHSGSSLQVATPAISGVTVVCGACRSLNTFRHMVFSVTMRADGVWGSTICSRRKDRQATCQNVFFNV